MVFIFSAAFVPRVNIAVRDVRSANVQVVQNIPLGIGWPASVISRASYWLTESFETAFGDVDAARYTRFGVAFPQRVVTTMLSVKPITADGKMSLTNFTERCIVPEILENSVNLQLEFEEQLPKSDKRTPQGSEREALHQTATLTQVSALFISNRHGACGLSKSGRASQSIHPSIHPSVDQGLIDSLAPVLRPAAFKVLRNAGLPLFVVATLIEQERRLQIHDAGNERRIRGMRLIPATDLRQEKLGKLEPESHVVRVKDVQEGRELCTTKRLALLKEVEFARRRHCQPDLVRIRIPLLVCQSRLQLNQTVAVHVHALVCRREQRILRRLLVFFKYHGIKHGT